MINKPAAFKGLNIRIPSIIPIEGRGFINRGSGLGFGTGCFVLRSSAQRFQRSWFDV